MTISDGHMNVNSFFEKSEKYRHTKVDDRAMWEIMDGDLAMEEKVERLMAAYN